MRLDAYVTYINPDISRTRAKQLIESGAVALDGVTVKKPAFQVDDSLMHSLEVDRNANPYVSRGGFKLEGALKAFGVDPALKVCADIGASTGGFTDCLLKSGASRVYAIDSGSDQLAPSLLADDRVVSMENFNARNLSVHSLGELCDLAVADLSFISQTYVLHNIADILKDGGEYIGLIKPQFECGRSALNKNGIVKDKKQHIHAIKKVINAAEASGLSVIALTRSSIEGGDGNVEFLYHAVKSTPQKTGVITDKDILLVTC